MFSSFSLIIILQIPGNALPIPYIIKEKGKHEHKNGTIFPK